MSYTTAQASVFIDVTPAPLTITAEDKDRPYGATNPTLTAGYDGFVLSETEAVLDTPGENSQ